MSGSLACRCATTNEERKKLLVVFKHKFNTSSFNGGHWTSSAYSSVGCTRCGRSWRTKAAYVEELRVITPVDFARLTPTRDADAALKTDADPPT